MVHLKHDTKHSTQTFKYMISVQCWNLGMHKYKSSYEFLKHPHTWLQYKNLCSHWQNIYGCVSILCKITWYSELYFHHYVGFSGENMKFKSHEFNQNYIISQWYIESYHSIQYIMKYKSCIYLKISSKLCCHMTLNYKHAGLHEMFIGLGVMLLTENLHWLHLV